MYIDDTRVDAGLWGVLCGGSLIAPEGSYESDVTVEVSPVVYTRVLRISRVDFQQALYPMSIAVDKNILQTRLNWLSHRKVDSAVILNRSIESSKIDVVVEEYEVPVDLASRAVPHTR